MTQTINLRNLIGNAQNEIAKKEFTPERATELLRELSALKGNINDYIRERDIAYNKILLAYLDTEKTSSRAKIKAECSEEYKLKREARDLNELAKDLISSLKYTLTVAKEDFWGGKHQ